MKDVYNWDEWYKRVRRFEWKNDNQKDQEIVSFIYLTDEVFYNSDERFNTESH